MEAQALNGIQKSGKVIKSYHFNKEQKNLNDNTLK